MVEHIQTTSAQPIQVEALIVNFNIDPQDRVWLLWCEQVCKLSSDTILLFGNQS